MRRAWTFTTLISLVLLAVTASAPVFAQEDQPQSIQSLTISTRYPIQEAAIGETVSLPLTLQAGSTSQIVRLSVQDLPEGWAATFRGGGRIIAAAYVQSDKDASVDLKIEIPPDAAADSYRFTVVAQGEGENARLPIELILEEKLPPSLAFSVDLPTIRGAPSSTFRFNVNLKNEGDQDLSVNLVADAPAGFQVTFKSSSQDVTSLPLAASESKRLNVEVKAFTEVPAGSYPIVVLAQGGEVDATTTLTAEVTGQPELSITTPDGRLSGQAHAGDTTPLELIVRNTGSAPARNITLSASQPSSWSVEFAPQQIGEIPPGEQVEVTASIQPAEKAIAGDYVVTVRARAEDSPSKSAEFRITVRTSTAWGVVGVALIAVAVAVVGLAVTRFGRR